MKTAYFNCSSGIAGDMVLAACIDAGINPVEFRRVLKRSLGIAGWDLVVGETGRYHFPCRTVSVRGDLHFHSPAHMKRIIGNSGFSRAVKEKSLKILEVLVTAEAAVHRVPPKKVHFHELNSIDTLVDITGAALAVEMLGISRIAASPVNAGKAAPAALSIAASARIPVYADTNDFELMTPTGAAVIAVLADMFGPMPCMTLSGTGYSAGSLDLPGKRNVLSVAIGEEIDSDLRLDTVAVLETNIDDMDPRIYPFLFEKLFAAGAKDVWLTQVLMKKGRPGIVLSAIAAPEDEGKIATIIFNESTTLGIRTRLTSRYIIMRKTGADMKTAFLPQGKRRSKSEYEVFRKKAMSKNIPLKNILI